MEEHSIYVGEKPFMNYVTSVVMQFTTLNATEVTIRARGKFISRAVDIAQVAMKRFLVEQVRIKDIKIGSEQFKTEEGRDITVSTIDIILEKA